MFFYIVVYFNLLFHITSIFLLNEFVTFDTLDTLVFDTASRRKQNWLNFLTNKNVTENHFFTMCANFHLHCTFNNIRLHFKCGQDFFCIQSWFWTRLDQTVRYLHRMLTIKSHQKLHICTGLTKSSCFFFKLSHDVLHYRSDCYYPWPLLNFKTGQRGLEFISGYDGVQNARTSVQSFTCTCCLWFQIWLYQGYH